MEMDFRKLEQVVKTLLAERFSGTSIHKVAIKSDTDSDGDKVLRITVVLESDTSTLNREALAGFVRHLRPKLEDIHAEEFPLVSFVSKAEAHKLQLEPA